MTRHLHHKASSLLLVLMLLSGHALEFIPDTHAHEDGHACMQLDGSFYYIDEVAHDHDHDEEGPFLRGMRIGDNHDHPECPFCQLVSFDLKAPRQQLAATQTENLYNRVPQPGVLQAEHRRKQARAPPISA